jgi:ABC-type transport system involved in multi-copper enzyme maturation permease subunit
MVLEREPYKLADVWGLVLAWLQDAGGFAAVAFVIGLIAYLSTPKRGTAAPKTSLAEIWKKPVSLQTTIAQSVKHLGGGLAEAFRMVDTMPKWGRSVFVGSAIAAAASYFAALFLYAATVGSVDSLVSLCLTIGGFCSILAVTFPFVFEVSRFRLSRIGALAMLTFREAIRRQILWAYALLIVVLMFADWFMQHKPENQLATYVTTVYLTMLLLLLISHAVLASFSIPTDIQNQTIHTIVTKPVERFEIVLGRFLGYTLLMTVALLGMTTLGVLYVYAYGIHPDAREESLHARVPVYGDLKFFNKGREGLGESVGKEWEYRKYVGGNSASARAVWEFRDLPSDNGPDEPVSCEFRFDVFRMTKGEEGKGVICSFTFATPKWDESQRDAFNRDREAERGKPDPLSEVAVTNLLARKYGLFEVRSKEIVNGHTLAINLPPGLFQNARTTADPNFPDRPLLRASVKCESPSQFIGVAKHDLYLLEGDRWFLFNFYKGVVGIWFQLALIIGVAVACSTYLSGVISLVCALFLFGAGLTRDFIQSIAEGKNEGGGPAEAFYRTINNQNQVMPLPDTAGQVTTFLDEIFRWCLRRFVNLVPDVQRFDLTKYVGAGFNISAADLTIGTLLLLGYLLPWLLLSYYLIKSREIAS